MKLRLKYGPVLIMVAAALWALDALVRTQLTFKMLSAFIVFFEHLVGAIILLPIFVKSIPAFKKLKRKDWAVLLLMTLVSSVLGTVLFTEALTRSFAVGDFASPVLLQKLQPIFVIVLSFLFLKERPTLRFFFLVPLALIGSYMISFGTEPVGIEFAGREAIYLLAVGAAFAWGSGTIMSKHVLTKLSFSEATSLRFVLAVPISLIFVFVLNHHYPLGALTLDDILRFVIIAFSSGAASILIYYKGLQVTPARVATIAELTFPIVALLIAISSFNPYGQPQILVLSNIFGILILLISILLVSFESNGKELDNR